MLISVLPIDKMIITQTLTMARWQIVVKKSEATNQTKDQLASVAVAILFELCAVAVYCLYSFSCMAVQLHLNAGSVAIGPLFWEVNSLSG